MCATDPSAARIPVAVGAGRACWSLCARLDTFHDQFVWFPWDQRLPDHLNEADAGSAADIHLWFEMYLQAIRLEYRPAYRAVIRHGAAALRAAAEVRAPGVYLLTVADWSTSVRPAGPSHQDRSAGADDPHGGRRQPLVSNLDDAT